MRAHQNTRGRVSQAQKRITKETKRFGTLVVFGVPVWTPTDAQTNTGSSDAHVQWVSHRPSTSAISVPL